MTDYNIACPHCNQLFKLSTDKKYSSDILDAEEIADVTPPRKRLSRKYAKREYRDIRVDAGFTTVEIGELAGTSGCTVSNFERGACMRPTTKKKLQDVYKSIVGDRT